MPAAGSSNSDGLDLRRAWLKHGTDTKRLAPNPNVAAIRRMALSTALRPALVCAKTPRLPPRSRSHPVSPGPVETGTPAAATGATLPPMVPCRSARLVALLAAVGAAAIAACSSDSQPVSCPAGQTACDGLCFDLQADPLSCGTCLRRCPTGATCAAGACACPAGGSVCGAAPGACFDLSTDPTHCGGCDSELRPRHLRGLLLHLRLRHHHLPRPGRAVRRHPGRRRQLRQLPERVRRRPDL